MALRTARELLEKRGDRAIRRALDSEAPGERLGAAMACSERKTQATAKALRRALANDRDAEVRSAAAHALGQRGGADSIAALSAAAADDRSTVVRGGAVEALGITRNESAVPALVAALKEASARPWPLGLRARLAIGTMAAEALGKIGGAGAAAALGGAFTSLEVTLILVLMVLLQNILIKLLRIQL